MKINVILIDTVRTTDRLYTYNLSRQLEKTVRIGSRVMVPFGAANRLREAVVFSMEDGLMDGYKMVHQVFDEGEEMGIEMVNLVSELKDYYLSSYSRLIRAMLPVGSKHQIDTEYIFQNDEVKEIYENDKGSLDKLIANGDVSLKASFHRKNAIQYIKIIHRMASVEEIKQIHDKTRSNAVKQLKLLSYFMEPQNIQISMNEIGVGSAVVKKFVEQGLFKIIEKRSYRNTIDRTVAPNSSNEHLLNVEQQRAYDQILEADGYESFLLHGVTGSGKTEIYLQLTREQLIKGKQVIILVPEISLIPQMAQRFVERFGQEVAFYHSKMNQSEKMDEWHRIKNGEFRIVIGARSAVFAPMKDIGLIIIDEEHSKSYKSESEPKYEARHVARLRAMYHKAPLVLGSATPSIESYTAVEKGKHQLIMLNYRVNQAEMPQVSLVDMRRELEDGNRSIFSRDLRKKMNHCIEQGQQCILFINKKGYSSFISCRSCGYVVKCPHCDLPLIYHKRGHYGECRICSYKTSISKTCPECGSPYFKHFGIGTEKIEEMINKNFEDARVIRMDSISMQRKNALNEAYQGIQEGVYNVILGTQIVAKGHDFKNVTLVGILAADINLNVPSYNASETAYQLLTQAIGRSGRGELKGNVVIQTYSPDHYAVTAAYEHNYHLFANYEKEVRSSLGYPPYRQLMNIMILSNIQDKAMISANRLASNIKKGLGSIKYQIIGPGPAILEKAKNLYRYQIVLKFDEVDQRQIKGIINSICDEEKDPKIYINIDVDPISLI
jgi:primosomal protein N' (replication factor Y)